jgi:hypothetical protein
VTDAAVAETHSAVVFFVDDRAYKLKKPVDLGFLDFRTLGARRAVCEREVELNRRLAPDVYLGVADVTAPTGEVCEHLVVMRRMPDDRRLASLVTGGAPVDDHLWQLAHLLASFHAGAARGPAADEAASAESTRRRWRANTDQLLPFTGRLLDGARVAAVQALADRYLAGREPLFAARIADGRACDGHGDLLADDIFCLDDGPRVLDCIEFDDSLRLGDGLADVAFLAMDLERLGRADLARSFLAAYREHTGDTWPASLAHHHVAYRAQVRAKVAAIRADQGDPAAAGRAWQLVDLALSHLEDGRVRLVLVGGLPGTGKSTLAAGLADRLDGAVVLRSDELRKERAGLPPTMPAPAAYGHGIYSATSTQATYDELLRRAEVALGLGETVICDASWHDGASRDAARAVAELTSADLVELRCVAAPAVAATRLAQRSVDGSDPSDATPAIAAEMAASMAPWPSATSIETTGDAAAVLAEATRVVRSRPSVDSDPFGSAQPGVTAELEPPRGAGPRAARRPTSST